MKLLGLLSFFCMWQAALSKKIINCYYDSRTYYLSGEGSFLPSFINPNLCTHISYGSFGVTETGKMISKDPTLDNGGGLIKSLSDLKKQNPNLKLIAVVGNGPYEENTKYNDMVYNATTRETFSESSVSFIKSINFDGLMLYWKKFLEREYAFFHLLMKDLKKLYDQNRLELSVGANACSSYNHMYSHVPGLERTYYKIPNLNNAVHYVNLMVFTRYLPTNNRLDHYLTLPEVRTAIDLWTKNGVPASKIVLGVGAFGHTFQMADITKSSDGDTSIGPGNSGPFTVTKGFLGYNEICRQDWKHFLNVRQGVPYATLGNQWVSFDNEYSIQMKMDIVNSRKMAGALMYTLAHDDFRGSCGRPYPLLNVINDVLRFPEKNGGNNSCKSDRSTDGYHLLRNKCSESYRCFGGTRYNFTCPGGKKFDIGFLQLN